MAKPPKPVSQMTYAERRDFSCSILKALQAQRPAVVAARDYLRSKP
jgi:hypothetical protein